MQLTPTELFESEQRPATTIPLSSDLDTLDLSGMVIGAMLAWWLSLSAPPVLRTIRLYRVYNDELAIIEKFIGAVGHDLESFTLCPNFEDCTLPSVIFIVDLTVLTTTSGMSSSIDITPLTHLRSIHFVLQNLHHANRNRWVTKILSQISSVHLEDVAFQLYAFTGSPDTDLSDALEWDELDAILQRPTFSRLKNVWFQTGLPLWNTVQAPDPQRLFSAQLMEGLPRCRARGISLG
jgi:hypothetical protein